MKKFLAVLFVAAAVCFSGVHSWAAFITPDVVTSFYLNGSPTAAANPYVRNGSSVTYSHNILDNGFSIGDTLTSVSITFSIYDNDQNSENYGYTIAGAFDFRENVTLLTDGAPSIFEIDNGSTIELGLAQLQADGLLIVTLTPIQSDYCTRGQCYSDFYLYSSTLNAEYTDNTPDNNSGNTSVPEPATLLLLGLGVMGLAGAGRKIS